MNKIIKVSDPIEDIIFTAQLINECGGRCPNCYSSIIQTRNINYVAS